MAVRPRPTFVFEDTANHDYRHVRTGLLRRGWQQTELPRDRLSEGTRDERKSNAAGLGPRWTRCRGSMGVASERKKCVSVPDLIWTFKCGRTPPLGSLGKEQVVNFFDGSSCLTTKAGLCRTLQSTRCSGEGREDVAKIPSFFPRCFDLGDPAQLHDFKDDFRQTAAAAVLKVYRRLMAESPGVVGWRHSACRIVPAKAEEHCRSGAGHCFGGLHGWMLALAVRAGRRRLLEMSGWQDNHVGKPCETHGAETLTTREWDSLLLYSYLLRRAVEHEPASRNNTCTALQGIAGRKEHVAAEPNSRDLGRIPDEGQERLPAGKLRNGYGCDDCVSTNTCDIKTAGVGARELYRLRNAHPRATVVSQGNTGLVRRPSSAPARPHPGKGVSQNPSRLATQGQTRATRAAFTARNGKADSGICCAGPGAWGLPEQEELLHGLSRLWKSAGVVLSTSCIRRCGVAEGSGQTERSPPGMEWTRESVISSMVEATHLCAALERRCSQWKIDGESNIWILKPAGASRGQGVRLAWTLDQVFRAQRTMGGRVVQKYVENPLLLSRRPSKPGKIDRTRRPYQRRNLLDRKRHRHEGFGGVGRSREKNADSVDGTGESGPGRPRSDTEPKTPDIDMRTTFNRPGTINKGTSAVPVCAAAAAKFDIRLWVLVTEWSPLEAFLYDDCYLRVCPRPFTLAESHFGDPDVHLTNLSVRRPTDGASGASAPLEARRRWPQGPKTNVHAGDRNSHVVDGHVGTIASAEASPAKPVVSAGNAVVEETSCAENDDAEAFVASQAELIRRLGEVGDIGGIGWSSLAEQGEPGEDGQRAIGERLWKEKVLPSFEYIVRDTLVAAQSHVRPRAASFQLFGFDVLLDQELHPWLLEVNLSPALSHTSNRRSGIIRSMCEGLLGLTVDCIDRGAPNSRIPNDIRTCRTRDAQGRTWNPTEKWKAISTLPSTGDNARYFLRSCVNPGSNVRTHHFVLRGQHLSRRGLVRAERGVREAIAACVIGDWWKYRLVIARQFRERRACAVTVLSQWVHMVVVQRRRRALRAKYERSASIVQREWRQSRVRMLERQRLAVQLEACLLVQNTWRFRRLERLRRARRMRYKFALGLKACARVLHSRRRKRVADILLHAVMAAKARKSRRQGATVVLVRAMWKTARRRRQSRLRLQRFVRVRCLLPLRLSGLRSVRAIRKKNTAAAAITTAIRNAVTRSRRARIVLAARSLQVWWRTVRWKWKKQKLRQNSIVIVQRAWRRTRQQTERASLAKRRPNTDTPLHKGLSSAAVEEQLPSTHFAMAMDEVRPKMSEANNRTDRGTAGSWEAYLNTLASDNHPDNSLPHDRQNRGGAESLSNQGLSHHSLRHKDTSASNSTTSARGLRPPSGSATWRRRETWPQQVVLADSRGADDLSISSNQVSSDATTLVEDWTYSAQILPGVDEESCCGNPRTDGSCFYDQYDTAATQEDAAIASMVEDINLKEKITNNSEAQKPRHGRRRTSTTDSVESGKERHVVDGEKRPPGILTLDCIMRDRAPGESIGKVRGKARVGRVRWGTQYQHLRPKKSEAERNRWREKPQQRTGRGGGGGSSGGGGSLGGFRYNPPAGGAMRVKTRAPGIRIRDQVPQDGAQATGIHISTSSRKYKQATSGRCGVTRKSAVLLAPSFASFRFEQSGEHGLGKGRGRSVDGTNSKKRSWTDTLLLGGGTFSKRKPKGGTHVWDVGGQSGAILHMLALSEA